MKYSFVLLSLATMFIIAATSFQNRNNVIEDNGSIGDVKYSVLPPDQFMRDNQGWILMDGGTSRITDSIFKKSVLYLDFGFQALPDARGVFVRGMNLGRASAQGDSEGDGTIGRYQIDAIKKHTHNFSNSFGFFCGWTNNNSWTGGQRGHPMAANNPECAIKVEKTGENLAGEETRPRNITLYIYIKVN